MVALPLRGALAFRAEPRKPMGNLMARARGSEAPAAGASVGASARGAARACRVVLGLGAVGPRGSALAGTSPGPGAPGDPGDQDRNMRD